MFTAVLDRADDLLLRMRGREDQMRPHALEMVPAVETICLTLDQAIHEYPLGPLMNAIEPRRRDMMAASLLALDHQATAVVLETRDDNTAETKADFFCTLAVQAVFALATMRPLLEQLIDDTPLNRRLAGEIADCLSVLDTLVGP